MRSKEELLRKLFKLREDWKRARESDRRLLEIRGKLIKTELDKRFPNSLEV